MRTTIQTESIIVYVDKDMHIITYTNKQKKNTVVGGIITKKYGN